MPLFGANLAQGATPLRDKKPFKVCGLPRVDLHGLRFTQTFHNDQTNCIPRMKVTTPHQTCVYSLKLSAWVAECPKSHADLGFCFSEMDTDSCESFLLIKFIAA